MGQRTSRHCRSSLLGSVGAAGYELGKQGVRGVKQEEAATGEHLGNEPHGSDELDVKLPLKLKYT